MNGYKIFPAFLVVLIFLVPTVIAPPVGETSITISSGGTGGDTGGNVTTKANGASCSAASECTGGYCNSGVCASSAPTPSGGVSGSSTGGTTTTTAAAPTTTTTVVTESKTISTIASGASGTVKLTKVSDLKVESLVINVKNAVTDVQITVKESSSASLPSGTPAPVATDKGDVFKYLEITKSNITDTDVNNVTVRFIVEKSWAENNSINVSTIVLQRLVGTAWVKLKTTLKEENATVYKFEAVSSGLSFFTITGEKKLAAPTVKECPSCQQPSTWSDCANNKQTRTSYRCSVETNYICQSYAEEQACGLRVTVPKGKTGLIIGIIAFGIIAAIVVYLLYQRKILKF